MLCRLLTGFFPWTGFRPTCSVGRHNRRTGKPEHPLAGGLFTCQYCGQSLTGERIRRKLKDGGIREQLYYRCANNHREPNHSTVRWKSDELEQAIVDDLARMRLASPEVASWFRTTLSAAVKDLISYRRRQTTSLAKRKSELVTMQDRLLNAYLAGTVDEDVEKAKSNELRAEAANVDATLAQLGDVDPARGENAVQLFDWTQNAAELWRGLNCTVCRQILDSVCLNRTIGDVTLCLANRAFRRFRRTARFKEKSGRQDTVRTFSPGVVEWNTDLRRRMVEAVLV